jgi:hypothetical protein
MTKQQANRNKTPVPTIVQRNNVSSDFLLDRTKEALSFLGFDPQN